MAGSTNNHISKTPGFRQGEPHITGRHISVEFIADLYINHDLSAEDIASNQDLALAQVHAALAYYYDHPEEIGAIWQEQEQSETKADMSRQEAANEQARLEAQLKERHPDRHKMLVRLRAEDPQREMTVPEIAAEFKLTEQAIRKAAKNQSVPAHKMGRDWVISRADALAQWGGQRRTSAKASISAHAQKGP
jgi:uncharacterized protein (DUF433 family)